MTGTRTLCTPTDALDAIWHGHQDAIGGPCSVALLTLLAAQSALETGRWHSMWNWNFGNIRGSGDAGSVAIPGANEIIDGKAVVVEAGFAAYSSRLSGARAFVRFLGVATKPPHPNRYAKAWLAAEAGDVDRYVAELKAAGYFTANEAAYAKGVRGTVEWLRAGPVPDFLAYLAPAQGTTP